MSILSTSSKLVRVGYSYSAGEGISIENNTISVTGDYGHAYYPGENISISDDNVISSKDWSSDIDTAVQNASAETTAWVDSQNYLTDADMSDYALITDVETTSGLLKMDIDTVSGSISGKMDSTAFNDWQNGQYANDIGGLANDVNAVSGAVNDLSATVEGLDIPTHQEIIDASGYAYSQSTAWVNNQGYLTQHQDISYLATKNEVDTVSSFLSGAIDYVSANAGDEFPASANDAITAYQNASGTYLTSHQSLDGYLTKTSADTLYQPIGSYASQTDLEQVSGDLKGDIDYISGVAITAHQDISNKLDTTAFSTVSGTFLTAVDLTPYATTGDLNTASSFLSGAINDVSGQIPVIPDMSATEWNSVYDSVESKSGLWNEMTAYQNASGTFLTAHQSLDNYYTKSETSGADELADAFANIPAGDAEVNAYVQNNSATIDNVSTTVQTNSAQWAEGTSVDTVPVAVISPLVTGFSGESAYLGIESTALNLSSYVPVSAIGFRIAGGDYYVRTISGKTISAMFAATANHAYTANVANYDSNYNLISSYYQPKLTITGDAGTITSINGSAVGVSIPEGWELVAGQGIEIVDDAENNQTTISVTAAGGNPEVESYVQSNSASIDDAVSTYQTNSGSYITQETDWTNTITAASSYAYSEAVAQIPAPFDPSYMSGQIDNKLNTTSFSDVSGSFLTAVNIPESASWNDATTSYQTNSSYYNNSITDLSSKTINVNYSQEDLSGVSFDIAPNLFGEYALTSVSGIIQNHGRGVTATIIPEHLVVSSIIFDGSYDLVNSATVQNWNATQSTLNSNSANWNDATTAYQTNSGDYLKESELGYNAVDEVSAINGSAIAQYGAEKQWLVHDDTLVHASNSAQYALGVAIDNVARLMGIDETVLYENANGGVVNMANTFTLNESLQNFEMIKIIDNSLPVGGDRRLTTIPVSTATRSIATNDAWFDVSYNPTADASKYIGANFYSANDAGTQIRMNGSYIKNMAATGAWTNRNEGRLYKIIGVHRISG